VYLIDISIFLELFLDQQKADSCEELLGQILEGNVNAVVPKFSVHAVEGVLADNPRVVGRFLESIGSSINIEIVKTNLSEEREIAEVSQNISLGFDDALQYSVAKRENVEAIISFDSDFDKTDLERKEPEEVLD